MIGMGKKQSSPRNVQQKELVRLMESIEGKYSKWEIWQDFIIMMAVSIANTFPGPHRAQREKRRLHCLPILQQRERLCVA